MRNSYQNCTTGFLAIGQCDNLGKGQQDVWICHIDSLGDTLKTETLGGEENDYGHAAVLVPSVLSVFIAGYNNSYGIEESGNAYLGGVKVDMGLPESGECVIPRVLWVDKVLQRPETVVADLLGDLTRETALIQFAKDNKIGYLALYNLGLIFDNHNDHHQYIKNSKDTFKNKLDNFTVRCNQNGIRVGMVMDQSISAIMGMAQYNLDHYNNLRTGKINFQVLEHEYWNAYNTTILDTTLSKNSKPALNSSNTTPTDNYFQELHEDHLTLLFKMDSAENISANFWGVYDYIAYLYLNLPDPDTSSTTYNLHYLQAQQDKGVDLYDKSDGIFLGHYQHFGADSGTAFLDTTSTNRNVKYWRNRLHYFGVSSTNKTQIIPFFFSEDNTYCGDGPDTPFLGHVLEDPPHNGGKTLRSVEGNYNSQHKMVYSHSYFPGAQNTELSAYAWFKYSCIKDKTFSNIDLHQCSTLGFGYQPLKDEEISSIEGSIRLFPNPTSSNLTIKSEGSNITKIQILNLIGTTSLEQKVNTVSVELDLSSLPSAMYLIRIELENKTVHQLKFIKK